MWWRTQFSPCFLLLEVMRMVGKIIFSCVKNALSALILELSSLLVALSALVMMMEKGMSD